MQTMNNDKSEIIYSLIYFKASESRVAPAYIPIL